MPNLASPDPHASHVRRMLFTRWLYRRGTLTDWPDGLPETVPTAPVFVADLVGPAEQRDYPSRYFRGLSRRRILQGGRD